MPNRGQWLKLYRAWVRYPDVAFLFRLANPGLDRKIRSSSNWSGTFHVQPGTMAAATYSLLRRGRDPAPACTGRCGLRHDGAARWHWRVLAGTRPNP